MTIPEYRQQLTIAGVNIPQVQPATGPAEMQMRASQQLAQTSDAMTELRIDTAYKKAEIDVGNELMRIEAESGNDPDVFSQKVEAFHKGYSKGLNDPIVQGRVQQLFDASVPVARLRVEQKYKGMLDQDASVTAIKGIDQVSNDAGSLAPMLFDANENVRAAAYQRFELNMTRAYEYANQKDSTGNYIFSPQQRVSMVENAKDQTVGTAIVSAITSSADPVAALEKLRGGGFVMSIPTIGEVDPMQNIAPDMRQKVFAQIETAIGERSKAFDNAFDVFEQAQKLQMEIDPTHNLEGAYKQFMAENGRGALPASTMKADKGYLSLLTQQAKATSEYREALPYMMGSAAFDGSPDAKKNIIKGFDILKKKGVPLSDRAKWLSSMNMTEAPTPFIDEMNSGLQAALVKSDFKALADVVEAFDSVAVKSPMLSRAVSDKAEGAIMMARDLMRAGVTDKDAFNNVKQIFNADPKTISDRKEALKEIDVPKIARDLAGRGVFNIAPDKKAQAMQQMATEYSNVFAAKFLATGDEKLATEAADRLLGTTYGDTRKEFSADGFMRMPPEQFYSLSGDTDTSWMVDDMIHQLDAKGIYDPSATYRIISNPYADAKKGAPEYLVVKDDGLGVFDSTGYVWRPDTMARNAFLSRRHAEINRAKAGAFNKVGPEETKVLRSEAQQYEDYKAFLKTYQAEPRGGEFMDKLARAESGGNADAKNPMSSASGMYQFTDATWNETVDKYGARYGITQSMKNDPDAQRAMAVHLNDDNAMYLERTLGRKPSEADLYAAWFLGSSGAGQLINAQGTAAIAADMFPSAAKANKTIFFDKAGNPRSVEDVYKILKAKVS